MTAFKFDTFSGLQPRMSESLLPPTGATVAQNCDFAYGELRNTKAGFLVNNMLNQPQSIYTDDGLLFFTWPDDVNAVRSPLASDTFDRLYYTTANDFRVTQRSGMAINGGTPASSYRVGVPKPTVAPTFTVPAAPSLTNATITAKFHYEYGGVKYQEQDILLSVVETAKRWTVAPPAADTATTPAQAFPVVRLTAKDNTTQDIVFDIYSSNSSLTDSNNTWTLAIAKSGSTYALTLTADVKESEKQTRAFVYTYVNTYNEEGPPSPPGTVTTMPTLNVTVGVTRDALAADYAPIKEIRIYETPIGSDIADYFYSGSIPVLTQGGTAFTFLDNVTASGLNEPLSSLNYYPPDPALVGLMALPNGILMAWKGNELHFSEAYKAWAWPPQYVKTFQKHNIVSAIAHGSGAVITTTGIPYLISGVSPDSMTETKVNVSQAGASKWAIADIGGAIAFASHDGIVIIAGGSATLAASEKFFTRDVWRQRYAAGLSSMQFAVWDGRLVVFSRNNAFTPFMIRLDEAEGTMTDLPDMLAYCSFVSQLSDQFYFAFGGGIFQFNGGTAQTAQWKSKEMVFPRAIDFAFAEAICEGNWDVSFFADGVSRYTKSLIGNESFRLPAGLPSQRWHISVTGTGRFRELRVAQSSRELQEI